MRQGNTMVAEAPESAEADSCPWAIQFDSIAALSNGSGESLRLVRRAAFQHFQEIGFPTPKQEEWKYTNVAPIARREFVSSAEGPAPELSSLSPFGLVDTAQPRAVFVNGRFSSQLSSFDSLPSGIRIGSIADLLSGSGRNEDAALLEAQLTNVAAFQDRAFVALNTAFFEDGAYVLADAQAVCETPLQLFYVATSETSDSACHPRLFLHACAGSKISVSEHFVGLTEQTYFTSSVSEIVVEQGAEVQHYKLQFETPRAFHISTTEIVQASHSSYANHSFSFGGALVRNDINPTINGEEVQTTLNGLSVLSGEQHVDNHTVIDHAKPHSQSNEWYKGVYADSARGVFNGTIIVRKDAQKTNAIQSNQALLLSKEATIDSKPQLKIWADDVRCTHGATVGQLDEEALFYLRSRGITLAEARDILIHGFASDVLEQLGDETLRGILENHLQEKLQTIRSAE